MSMRKLRNELKAMRDKVGPVGWQTWLRVIYPQGTSASDIRQLEDVALKERGLERSEDVSFIHWVIVSPEGTHAARAMSVVAWKANAVS